MRLIQMMLLCILSNVFALSKGKLTIYSDKPYSFSVEIASNQADQEKGLMHRRYMPKNEGMLFVYSPAQPVSMWMKNTYIPLDMIFIDTNNKIITLHENTTPLSLDVLSSSQNTAYVLEINAGLVSQYQIKLGQKIRLSSNTK